MLTSVLGTPHGHVQSVPQHRTPFSSPSAPLPPRTPAHSKLRQRRPVFASVAATDAQQAVQRGSASTGDDRFLNWLKANGVQQHKVTVQQVERAGQLIDTTVAAQDIAEGEIVLEVPQPLVVTLSSVFEDDAVAELLTTGKLSELAVLTLFMMYEKKEGDKSRWHAYIKELDKQRARGQQGAKSPLLWEPGEVDAFLAGSPVQNDIRQRLAGIEKEYEELDTVWFMAGSLFKHYPYDTPTEAFSKRLFRQAFAAVQGSVVHLQGVPLSQRFALVPLGPPLLEYSPTAKALLKWDPEQKAVTLTADRDYKAGDSIIAWCGPQPNSRLLVNYGVVEDDNPFDKLTLTATIPNTDPMFKVKRNALQPAGLATQQNFDLKAKGGLPPLLVPYLRVALARTQAELDTPGLVDPARSVPLSPDSEREVHQRLMEYLQLRLDRYKSTVEEDQQTIDDVTAKPRKRVAARLMRIEKRILNRALRDVLQLTGASELGSYTKLSSDVHLVKLT